MNTEKLALGAFACPLVRLDQDCTGRFTAQVVGLPESYATADTRAEAIEKVRSFLAERLARGELIALTVTPLVPLKIPGWVKDDLLEQEFLEELARRREEDLERTLRENEEEDQRCSGTSSTPTT